MRNQGFIIAREGIPWILLGLIFMAFFLFFHLILLSFLVGILTLFFLIFFRNPKRVIPKDERVILSPADGTICLIEKAYEKRFIKTPMMRVSIFMSPLNCHINRAPLSSRVVQTHYHSGKFHVAHVDKASDLNEQHALLLEDEQKNQLVVVQIAGWLARRIVSYVKSGDILTRGDRFGMIQFGSRVDIYLPQHITVQVKKGDKVKAGVSLIGKWL